MNGTNSTRSPETEQPVQEIRPTGTENQHEQQRPAVTERVPEATPVDLTPIAPVVSPTVPLASPVDPMMKKVEDVMADGMNDAYQSMDPAQRQEFKRLGEETASTIAKMLEQTKIQVKKIIELIFRWLRLIPHVNPYYLEQQARIKADSIINLKHPPREGS